MVIDKRTITRREVCRLASLASAGFLLGSKTKAHASNSAAIDVHGHLWADDFLDLMEKYGKKDVAVQRGKGAGIGEAEIEKRFAMMDSAGIGMQALSICPQAPQFEAVSSVPRFQLLSWTNRLSIPLSCLFMRSSTAGPACYSSILAVTARTLH
jgi:hypothetical protein